MKEEILKALTAKFPGVSASILGRIADKLSKTATTAEQVKTAVEGVTIQQVIESYGDSRATEASSTAVHNYETKHGLRDGQKIDDPTNQGGAAQNKPGAAATNPTPAAGGADDTPAWAKALIEQNKALSDRLAKMETDRTTTSRKQQLSAITEKLPEAMRKAYDRIPVDKYSEEEFNTLVTEVTTEVEGVVKDTTARGGVFGKPSAANAGGSSQNGGQLTKEQEEAIAHRDGAATKDGAQPF
jgi:hypothetical protein